MNKSNFLSSFFFIKDVIKIIIYL